MVTTPEENRISFTASAELVAALDAWIDRHEEPKPSREEAARQVLEGALGAHGPSSMIPNLVTGRDVV